MSRRKDRKDKKKKIDIDIDQKNEIDDITVVQKIDQYADASKGGEIKQDADNKAVVVVVQNNDADVG